MFIVIDGLDASGKSTQGVGLYTYFVRNGRTACLRIHPASDNVFGIEAKRFLLGRGEGAHLASALFYMADVIRSILLYSWRRFDYIIFVRYLMGTAYLPSWLYQTGYHFFASMVPASNFMFFLDVLPEEADKRIHQTRNTFEMFESLEDLIKVRKKAISLVSTGGWTVIDGNKSKKEVEAAIREVLNLPF